MSNKQTSRERAQALVQELLARGIQAAVAQRIETEASGKTYNGSHRAPDSVEPGGLLHGQRHDGVDPGARIAYWQAVADGSIPPPAPREAATETESPADTGHNRSGRGTSNGPHLGM